MLDIPRRLATGALPALLCLLFASVPTPVEAQMPGIMDYFGGFRRWAGDRVHPPAPTPRPDLPIVARSVTRPLAVHAGADVSEARVREALEALELAHDVLAHVGFSPPPPDGGRGGGDEVDLYLSPAEGRVDDAGADPLVLWSYLDSAPAFAMVDSARADDALGPCVTSAYAQAVLLGQDPAEAPGWRHATATYLTWLVTGSWGCDEKRVVAQQQNAYAGWVNDDPEGGDGTALLLAELASRHDGGTGTFVCDVWQIARQRTWEGSGLRASPDLWESIEAALEISQIDDLETLVEDLAVSRYFTGRRAKGPLVRDWAKTLPQDALVPVSESFTWAELSKYTRPHDPEIAPFGSAYFTVDVSEAEPGDRLRLWLRGEFGVRWSFVAVSLDGRGRELNRMRAPPRRLTRSYLQIDFTTADSAPIETVLVVVTNLSARLPDADEPDENARSFRVILDQGE
jgi:hypothetical protein